MSDPNRRHLLLGTATAVATTGLATAGRAQSLVAGPDNWATLSRAQRDGAYNNSAAVPDSANIVDGWTRDSAALRQRFAGSIDLPYGPKPRNAHAVGLALHVRDWVDQDGQLTAAGGHALERWLDHHAADLRDAAQD